MFQLYLRLRLKNFGRIVLELGIFRIVFLAIVTMLATMVLFFAENRLAIPVVCIFLLGSYHNLRKDKEFLRTLTAQLPVFLMKEYVLIALPFAAMEMVKGRYIDAIALCLFAGVLPFIKEIKMRQKPIRLPLLYKGGYEYIRMFRQVIWLYALLLLFSIIGAIHGNIRIDKVCLILWGLVQASGYMQSMEDSYLLHFRNFRTLCFFQLKSIAWNTFITSAPLGITLILFSRQWNEVFFFPVFYIAIILYTMGISMLRHIIRSQVLLFMVQLILLLPFYLGSLFVPYLLLPEVAITLLLIYYAHRNIKTLL
mgnify:FL=1|jgi:hypothetical protein